VITDSRAVVPGSLFVALRGARFDGNAYALDALAKGAAAALVETGRAPSEAQLSERGLAGRAILTHRDPQRALLDLAANYRRAFAIPVIGIGGAAGKTTTKDIAAHLLARLGPTVASEKSYNNSIGVPHTLLRIDDTTKSAVVEIGTNAPGEVSQLSAAAAPTVGCLTIIAEEHLEGLGTLDAVAREEGDLLAALPESGLAVLNADDRYFPILQKRARCRVVTFGLEREADFRAENVVFHVAGGSFTVGGRAATVPLLGTHNIYNALAALAIARSLGLALEEGLRALGELRPPQRRLERKRFGEIEVLDDCYNANPPSVRAAIRALEGLRGAGRRILILGKMHELGAQSAALHREIGRAAGAAGFDRFVVIGAEAGELAAGAVEGGLRASKIVRFPTTAEAAYHLPEELRAGDLVLVKGSRAEGLERIVEAIRARFENTNDPSRASSISEGTQ
jgi:UDP-N-acetylmuramoyl-tripeptide--D-alanyl-D-alanine ligase